MTKDQGDLASPSRNPEATADCGQESLAPRRTQPLPQKDDGGSSPLPGPLLRSSSKTPVKAEQHQTQAAKKGEMGRFRHHNRARENDIRACP